MTVRAAYDDIAEWYDGWVRNWTPVGDPFFAPVHELLGEVAGARVCALACGQGREARYLAGRGARVVGVDISSKLLAIAAAEELAEPRGIAYVLDDAQGLRALRDASFDGVLCHMALMDIPELIPTLRAVGRVLRPGGWFVFSTLHPCYHTPASGEEVDAASGRARRLVSAYWEEGHWRDERRVGPPGKVGAYHRTLATYLNGLVDAGLRLDRVAEPRASGSLAESRPIWREVPGWLVARCLKTG